MGTVNKIHTLKQHVTKSLEKQMKKENKAVAVAATGAGIGGAGAIGAVSSLGVSGLGATGITSGLATVGGAVGGGMAAGVVLTAAAPLIAGAIAYGLYKWLAD